MRKSHSHRRRRRIRSPWSHARVYSHCARTAIASESGADQPTHSRALPCVRYTRYRCCAWRGQRAAPQRCLGATHLQIHSARHMRAHAPPPPPPPPPPPLHPLPPSPHIAARSLHAIFYPPPDTHHILLRRPNARWRLTPATQDRARDHLISATFYSQMLYQLSYSRSDGRDWVRDPTRPANA